MFIIPNPVAPQGIPEDTEFKTKTKGEVGDIRWFSLKDTFMPAKFFTVRPFIRDVRRWVPNFQKHQASYIEEWNKKNSFTKTDAAMGTKEKDSGGKESEAEKNADSQGGVKTSAEVQTKAQLQNLQVKKCELRELRNAMTNKLKIAENKTERKEPLRKARPKSRGL